MKHLSFKNIIFCILLVLCLVTLAKLAINTGFATISYMTWSDRPSCQPQTKAYKSLTLKSEDTFQVYSKEWTWSGVTIQREGTNLHLDTGETISFPKKHNGGVSLFLPLPGEEGQIMIRCSLWHFRIFSFQDYLEIEP